MEPVLTQDAEITGAVDSLRPIGDIQLAVNVVDVLLHSTECNEKFICDSLVGMTICHQVQNIEFALAQGFNQKLIGGLVIAMRLQMIKQFFDVSDVFTMQ